MTCAHYQRWFSPYVDGLIDPQARAQLDAHLQGCAGCRGKLASLQQMLHTLRTMEPPAAPELLAGIRAKLHAEPWWRAGVRRLTAPWPASLPLHGLALATTALLVVVIANLPGVARRDKLVGERMQLASKPAAPLGGAPMSRSREQRDDVDWAKRRSAESPLADEFDADKSATQSTAVIDTFAKLAGETERAAGDRALKAQEPVAGTKDAALPSVSPQLPMNEVVPSRQGRMDQDVSHARAVLRATPPFAEDQQRFEESVTARAIVAPAPEAGAAAEPALEAAPEKKTEATKLAPSTASDVSLEPLQVQWRVLDLAAASSTVSEWVSTRQGLAVATNDHHLSIKLPASAVPEFLQQFTTDPPPAPSPNQPIWVTISLELVRTE